MKSFISAGLVLLAVGTAALPDTVVLSERTYSNVTVSDSTDNRVGFKLGSVTIWKHLADVKRITLASESSFNEAEKLFAAGDYAKALLFYDVVAKSTSVSWQRKLIAGRMAIARRRLSIKRVAATMPAAIKPKPWELDARWISEQLEAARSAKTPAEAEMILRQIPERFDKVIESLAPAVKEPTKHVAETVRYLLLQSWLARIKGYEIPSLCTWRVMSGTDGAADRQAVLAATEDARKLLLEAAALQEEVVNDLRRDMSAWVVWGRYLRPIKGRLIEPTLARICLYRAMALPRGDRRVRALHEAAMCFGKTLDRPPAGTDGQIVLLQASILYRSGDANQAASVLRALLNSTSEAPRDVATRVEALTLRARWAIAAKGLDQAGRYLDQGRKDLAKVPAGVARARLDAMLVVAEQALRARPGRGPKGFDFRELSAFARRNPKHPGLLVALIGAQPTGEVGTPESWLTAPETQPPAEPDVADMGELKTLAARKAYDQALQHWRKQIDAARAKVTWRLTVTGVKKHARSGEFIVSAGSRTTCKVAAVFGPTAGADLEKLAAGTQIAVQGTTRGCRLTDGSLLLVLGDCSLVKPPAPGKTLGALLDPSLSPPGGRITANFYGETLKGRALQVVYVIDRSGSMVTVFDYVRTQMLLSIGDLTERQHFHIILFADNKTIEGPGKGLVRATAENKIAVVKFLESDAVRPRGRTTALVALIRAFKVFEPVGGGKDKLILLLSDGELGGIGGGSRYRNWVGNDAVINWLADNNKDRDVVIKTYLYSHGTSAKAKEVMNTIAKDHGGRRAKLIGPDE